VTTFGEVLRTFRESTRDPQRHNRPLSQARLGELIGHTMQDRGFTGAAVSDWERGESKIHVEDRNVLIAIIKVLYKYYGIKTQQDANELLEVGDYRALNKQEASEIFGDIPPVARVEQSRTEQASPKAFTSFLLEKFFSLPDAELGSLLIKVEEGPTPSWPRVLAALMRFVSDRWSLSIRHVFWIAVWLAGWWLIPSSLRWPFADRESAYVAIVQYVGGTLIIPLLIGLLVDTTNNKYWQHEGLAHSLLLRLYTYQGAGIGFNLGYFFVFPLALMRYYLGLGPSVWVELTAVTLGLILANMAARVVPHNLWLAYGRLHLADGVLFFVVAFVGPLWGVFFLEDYSILLRPVLGSVIIIAALVLFLIIAARQSRKKVDSEQAQP
jgi:hypothetical protein